MKITNVFWRGTILTKLEDGQLTNIPIEKVNEDDMVLCIDKQGLQVYKPVIIKHSHSKYHGKPYQFILSNGN